MAKIKTDLLVIGAGSGGLSVAAGAVQMGADVTLLEGHKMGGDCLNYGCVPSKALLAAGHAAHAMTAGAAMGVSPVPAQVDYAKAKDHVASVIDTIAPVDSQERFEGLGVRVIREFGRFTGPRTVQAGEHTITARRVIIATGSSPFVPPIPGLDQVPYLTNETLFDLREKPDHLLIIGAGPIGMEMAQAHIRLGCKVTVIEGAKALGKDDPELAGIALDALRAEGVQIVEDAQAQRISGAGGVTVHTEAGELTGSHLLMAVGRRPNIDKLNLEAAGIDYERSGITVDDRLRTSNKKVYAIGDVAGGLQFTHVAGYHAGLIIREVLFGLPAKVKTAHIPWATYTDPEMAQVGLTEAQAREKHGDRLEVARFEYHHNDRAIAIRQTKGLIKVMVVKGRPVGASIVGHQAGELIATWSLAIANGIKMAGISAMIAPYPTIAEVNKRAAGAYFSPKLFDNMKVKRVVRFVQRWLP
ncbi:dihydrolipoyl dehydrogenase family protein [Thalassobius sp. S69A]|uniref:dihydrolipoyl dehydrogenase family protein n=1 Tax=unclassified Thalassovita TaxID=2619711 RepID=UPI000C0ECE25|nr:dihydrolipoamide dehydrogenase [Paracoccaceae bacterium]MBT25949.1 dihydrolipoamide dehydrogenase [Paracoccaceae bacterium]